MQRDATIGVITIWIALSCACACGTHRSYDGPALEPHAVATLETRREPRIHVSLDAVDGRRIPIWNARAEILPGTRVLETSVVIRLHERQVITTHQLRFEARAGRRYRVEAGLGYYGPGVTVTEVGTGNVVAEALTLPDDLPPVGSRDY